MNTFNSLDDLFKALENDINNALQDDVLEVTTDIMQEEIQTKVYDEYSPDYYVRRGSVGGLIDRDNINYELDNGVLKVTNDTPLNDIYGGNSSKTLTEIVTTGNGYTYQYAGAYMTPRNFIASSQKKIDDGIGKETLLQGLKKRGWEIK